MFGVHLVCPPPLLLCSQGMPSTQKGMLALLAISTDRALIGNRTIEFLIVGNY